MNWQGCKNILCIRPDNMGDVIMSIPALRALKDTFNANITLLTSSASAPVIPFISQIDELIITDLPWVKNEQKPGAKDFAKLISALEAQNFDAAVIFTVFSQNPMPNAMLAYLAGIPRILAYCRENPYHIINCWVPDKEPYEHIKHQVQRDLDLVTTVGAHTSNKKLLLSTIHSNIWEEVKNNIQKQGICLNDKWLVLHPGVSEAKRRFPADRWIKLGQRLKEEGFKLLITGSAAEKNMADELQAAIGKGSISIAGQLDLEAFISLIKNAPLLISVNSGPVHIAAAVNTKVIVLYAQTNPQHTPWMVSHAVFEFPVKEQEKSRNEVIRFLGNTVYKVPAAMPAVEDILNAVFKLLRLSYFPDPSAGGIHDQDQAVPTNL